MKETELKFHLAAKALDNLRNIPPIKGHSLNWSRIEEMKKELIEAALIVFEYGTEEDLK